MKKSNALMNCILSSTISLLFFFLCAATPLGNVISRLTGNLNLISMAMSVVLFLGLFLCLSRADLRFTPRLVIGFNATAVLFLLISMLSEERIFDAPDHVGIEHVSSLSLFLMTVIVIVILPYLLRSETQASKRIGRIGKPAFVCLAVLIAGLTAFNQYMPNVFLRTYNAFHFNAYTNSIWNVFWGQPYTDTVTSIYGHYAFLYYPFLKLAWAMGHTNLFKIYLLLSAATASASVLMWAATLSVLVKKTVPRMLGLLGVGYITCARVVNIYPQMIPHRTFPIAVAALMMAIWLRCGKKGVVNLIGYLVCIVLTLWSTEFGFFATVAWSALNCCYAIQAKGARSWLAFGCYILAIPMVFMLSLLICGLLNTAFGGSMLSVRAFIFPLMSHSYMQGYLEEPLAAFPAAWISIAAGLLGFLGLGLTDTVLYAGACRRNPRTAVYFGLAVLGLGSFTYAVNRPAYGNFYIMMPMMAVFMAIIAERGAGDGRALMQFPIPDNPVKLQRACLNVISVGVLTVIMLSFIVNVPAKLVQQAGYRDERPNAELMRAMIARGDGSEYAIGPGAVTAFAMMGWDPKVYFMDLPDISINPDAYEEMVRKSSELYGKNLFYSYDDYVSDIPVAHSSAFDLVEEFNLESQTFAYCKPAKMIRRNRHG